jgi:hypothetical protein
MSEVRCQMSDVRETTVIPEPLTINSRVVRLPARSSHCLVRSDDEDTNLVPFSRVVMGNDEYVGDECGVDRNGAVHF